MALSARRTGSAGVGLCTVAPEAQSPRGCHRRILLAQTPGRSVAGIGKGSFVSFCQFLIQAKEDRHRLIDLAAHLQQARVLAAREARRDRANRAQVGGDVLAHASVTPRGSSHEDTVLIEQRHRQPVDLELAHEIELVGVDMGTLRGFASPFGPPPATAPPLASPLGDFGTCTFPTTPARYARALALGLALPPAMVRRRQSRRAPHATARAL